MNIDSKLLRLVVVTLVIGITFSCQETDEEVAADRGVGSLTLSLDLDLEVGIINARSETVETDSFSVFVVNTESDTVASFDYAIDVPEKLPLPVGEYYVIAEHNRSGITAFETPHYWGKSELVSVSASETTPVTVLCYLANTMVTIRYSEHVTNYFSDYSTWVVVGHDSLYYEQSEQRSGYFSGGSIDVKAKLFNTKESQPIIVQGMITDPKTRHHYIITIDGYDFNGAIDPIDIQLDNNVDETKVIFSNTTLNDGLIAYYPLNGSAEDNSENNFDGLIEGATISADRNDFSRGAFYFDGHDDFIQMGDKLDSVFAGSDQEFSFSFWMKPDTVKKQIIFAKSSDTNCNADERQFHLKLTAENKLEFAAIFNPGFHHSHRVISSSQPLEATADWTHIAVTYNGATDEDDGLSRVSIFVNGEKVSTALSSVQGTLGAIQDGTAQFALGNQVNSLGENCGNFNYQGYLDEFRVYNRSLADTEITQLMSLNLSN